MHIIWTFNPFQNNEKLNIFGKNLIKNCFSSKDTIEAVYVASNAEVELSTAFNIPKLSRYSTYPKKIIQNQLNKISAIKIKVTILSSMKISLTSSVKELVQYSIKQKADLVVVATNSKKTLPAYVFGSFAETLIHLSSCNLLIYHQKTKFKSVPPQKILYAHDFTIKGTAGLLQISQYAKKWNATLIVLHIPTSIPDISDEEYEMIVDIQSAKNEKLLIKNEIKFMIMNIFDDAPIDQTLMRISKKEKVDLIALTAQSNKLQILMGGSVTRKILRDARIPVMVIKVS
jgi:nucleotide-binding universal stress UspA family protein